ncbi:murein transglycosylase D [Pantoea eucalypti]|jgi:membrane-bound lytic murein transglycosylase D|uniref:peptidoglycan lytic exotransglycosylase n=1 Tax=Pantoea eucalypti TaxID=470933 RepID=A0ABY2ZP57_9GAMM|nr:MULTISPECIES: murein transglycosylase D [Pantoea]PQL29039.1 murein transglycosylase D [Pantoea ananatis]QXG53963.1 murein transglycosylase D [Pantoea jilinensis]AWP33905.1 lytic transglycosylase [Pantoea vagans]MBD9553632.1 murein transglycosylase D [Pantoea sp. PNT01]MCD2356119.1 murein transglycosylase D [Pantoea sp. MHSD4]
MKAKAILLASVLLVGCQASRNDANIPEQHAQSLSSAGQGENGKYGDEFLSPRWQEDGTGLAADADLWSFISDELKMGIPENPAIREQKRKFLKNKSYLHDVTLRAEPYMYWIVEQIQKRKMPMELVLLPIVESAFDPRATSSANAAGIWQIVAATGRNYGLKQNQYYDGRRDVVASTKVALDMMQRLNTMFDGDWLLTIAAYNSGEGRVLKAIKQNKARGKPTDFWHLSLPRETTVYVPKMLALSELLKNNKRYGIKLPTPNESRALARVEVGQQIQLTQAAEMAGMSLTKLKSFNTGYKGGATAPNGPHYIMVPKSNVAKLRNSLASGDIAAVQPTQLAKASASGGYKVRRGDTLSGIAAKLGVSVSTLKQENNLRGADIRPGQTLTIGSNGTRLADNGNSITYRVRKGDSLDSIARHHGVNIKDVMRWNSVLDNAKDIQPGDNLTLFVNNNATPDT